MKNTEVMRKTLTLVALLAYALSTLAQDTVTPQTTRYKVAEAYFTDKRCRPIWGNYAGLLFYGPVFRTVEPLQIYGVAVLTNDAHGETGLPLRVKVAQKDESGAWRIVDSAQWHETGPERYFRYPLHPCDTTMPDSHHVSPIFEIYFNHPVTVFAPSSRAWASAISVPSTATTSPCSPTPSAG